MDLAAVIPAYQPGAPLVVLAEALGQSSISSIVVVNDGSGPACQPIFDRLRTLPKVTVLDHPVNLGKGAALKAGLNHALRDREGLSGVVTADADGQHGADDVLRVASAFEREPGALVLGVRQFTSAVPWRSRVGNALTRLVMRVVEGQRLTDTQTGLRGIPRSLALEMLGVDASGYEFELDMLVAARHLGYPVREVPIQTIYLDGNRTSHFNPLTDSMRIYFVLLRFGLVSLLTAAIDNVVFLGAFRFTAVVWESQAAGRVAAVAFNYPAARRAVFLSRQRHRITLPKYLLLVAVSGAASYALLSAFVSHLDMGVLSAKLLAESLLFLANFAIQRDFIFVRSQPAAAGSGADRPAADVA